MKVFRQETFDMFAANWCPKCGKLVAMEKVPTGLPGIHAQKCPECGAHYQANYLEDNDDLLDIPDNFILMPNTPEYDALREKSESGEMLISELKKPKHRRMINLDMDGVTADFDQRVFDLCGKWPDELDDDEMWAIVDSIQDFYRHLPKMEDCDWFVAEVLKLAKKHNLGVRTLTAIPRKKSMPSAEDDKKWWADQNIPDVPEFAIGPYSKDKWKHVKCKGDILIDDRKSNIEDWNTKPDVEAYGIFFKDAKQAIEDLKLILGDA